MKYLLDTNACIHYLRYADSSVRTNVEACTAGEVVVCSVGVSELRRGVLLSADPAYKQVQLDEFLADFPSLPFDDAAAEEHARIRVHLEAQGTPIGPLDTQIAAIARTHGLTLVTHNTAEFSRVPGLQLVDWQLP